MEIFPHKRKKRRRKLFRQYIEDMIIVGDGQTSAFFLAFGMCVFSLSLYSLRFLRLAVFDCGGSAVKAFFVIDCCVYIRR